MTKQIETLQTVYDRLIDAHSSYQNFITLRKQGDPERILALIADVAAKVSHLCERIANEQAAQSSRLYGGMVREKIYGGSHVREITVQRPDRTCKEHYISEASYKALVFAFGTTPLYTARNGLTIHVLSASGRKVATIAPLV